MKKPTVHNTTTLAGKSRSCRQSNPRTAAGGAQGKRRDAEIRRHVLEIFRAIHVKESPDWLRQWAGPHLGELLRAFPETTNFKEAKR